MSVNTLAPSDVSADVADFAAAMRKLASAHPAADTWTPAAACDDRDPDFEVRLADIGWFDLAELPDAAPLVGPAAYELGRALAPVHSLDRLLGAGLAVSSVGPGDAGAEVSAIGRYTGAGTSVVICGSDGVARGTVRTAVPVGFTDAVAAHRIAVDLDGDAQPVPRQRWQAWIAANTGYLAGLLAGAHELVLAHVTSRIAFGKPLIEIESVANKLADVAMTAQGLAMASAEPADIDVLRYAGPAVVASLAQCHQVVGAIGFTMEFPLQRYSRRAAGLASWNDPVLDALAVDSRGADRAGEPS